MLIRTSCCTDDEAIAQMEAAFRRRSPKPAKPRRRGTVGYHRDIADGATMLVSATDLPVGRLPRFSSQVSPKGK
ncbi:MAG TPA: hypothetical protein VK797_17785 [Tepidisphaeraceae bacterium]|nr:hypothetical protein [Tepidisphaeraceae bacterium]